MKDLIFNQCKERWNKDCSEWKGLIEDTLFLLDIKGSIFLFLGKNDKSFIELNEEYFFWGDDYKKNIHKLNKIYTNYLNRDILEYPEEVYLIYGGSIFKEAPFLYYWSLNIERNFPNPYQSIYDDSGSLTAIVERVFQTLAHSRYAYRLIKQISSGFSTLGFDIQDMYRIKNNERDYNKIKSKVIFYDLWLKVMYSIVINLKGKTFLTNQSFSFNDDLIFLHNEREKYFDDLKHYDLFISFYHYANSSLQCGVNDYIPIEIFNQKYNSTEKGFLGMHCESILQAETKNSKYAVGIFNRGAMAMQDYFLYVSKILFRAIVKIDTMKSIDEIKRKNLVMLRQILLFIVKLYIEKRLENKCDMSSLSNELIKYLQQEGVYQ